MHAGWGWGGLAPVTGGRLASGVLADTAGSQSGPRPAGRQAGLLAGSPTGLNGFKASQVDASYACQVYHHDRHSGRPGGRMSDSCLSHWAVPVHVRGSSQRSATDWPSTAHIMS